MGFSKQLTGNFAAGFVFFAGLAVVVCAVLYVAQRYWVGKWVSKGGRALTAARADQGIGAMYPAGGD